MEDSLLQQESAFQEMDQLLHQFKQQLQQQPSDSQAAAQPGSLGCGRWKRIGSLAVYPDAELSYVKRPGACGMDGQLYEIKMAFLVFLRCVRSSCCFYLASNLKGTGAFDDLVLRKEDKLTEATKTYFVQLKHRSGNRKTITHSDLMCLNGDFSLIKYFISYRDEICEQYSTKENVAIFSGTLDECKLIIYTNASMYEQTKEQLADEGLLHSGAGCNCYMFTPDKDPEICSLPQTLDRCYRFLVDVDAKAHDMPCKHANSLIKESISAFETRPKLLARLKQNPTQSELKKVIREISDIGDLTMYSDFLKKLQIYHSQSAQNNLDEIIMDEIKKYLETCEDDTLIIYKELLHHFETWWKDGHHYLTETTTFWMDILSAQKQIPYSLSKSKILTIKHLKLKFSNDVITALKSIISDTTVLHISATDHTILNACKVHQALSTEPRDNFIFMGIRTMLAKKVETFNAWHSKWPKVLIIECEYLDDELRALLDEISGILLKHPRKKLILITKESSVRCAISQEIPFKDYKDNISLLDLDIKSQEQILRKYVKFQGCNVLLGELVGTYHELKEVINEEILINLAKGEKMCIGEDLQVPISNYIPRMLERKDRLCLHSEFYMTDRAQFLVSGVSEEELLQTISTKKKVCTFDTLSNECQFVVINDSTKEQNFSVLSDSFEHCHWLHKDNKGYKVTESKGNIGVLKQHLSENQTSLFMPKTAWDLPGRTAVITAQPGMGKSTLITHTARQTKLASPSTWVVHVNLNNHTEFMDSLKCSSLDQEQVLQFLMTCAKISGQKNTFQERLFNISANTTGKMVVFFDGFDEICPYFEDICLKMLEILLRSKIDRIWITSRTTCMSRLETITSSLSYALTLFSEEEQKQFLHKVWKKRFTDLDTRLIGTVISELLELVAVSLNDTEKRFAAIPLQTMIISEVYEQHLKESARVGQVKLPDRLDILELYDGFFRKKFEIYFREKKGDNITKPAVRKDNELCWHKTDEYHKAVALMELLSQEDVKQLHDSEISAKAAAFVKGLESGTEMVGIIDSILDGKPHFIHRTFVEYFSAKWFAENYSLNQKFIKNKFLTEDFSVVRAMFDQILARNCRLHKAVMNKDTDTVKRLMETENVNQQDAGGRTPLHLAAISYNITVNAVPKSKHISQLLLDNGADVSIVDSVFQWTALRYSDATRAWCTIGLILQHSGSADDLILTRMNVNNPSYIKPALNAAAENGYIELLEFLVKLGIKVDTQLGRDKCHMIHIAAQHNQITAVQSLLRMGSKLHARDAKGWTPLHYSARAGNLHMLKFLLGRSYILDVDKQKSSQHIKQEKEDKCKSTMQLALKNSFVLAIQKKCNANIRDYYGRTALHHAASTGQLEVVQYLVLDRKMDVNAQDKDGWTPLHYASSEGHLPVVEYLTTNTAACVAKRDKSDRTALHCSVIRGKFQVVKFLTDKMEAHVINLKDSEGWAPLHYATMGSWLDIARCLAEKKGVNVNATDKLGQTPLDVACGSDIKTYFQQKEATNK